MKNQKKDGIFQKIAVMASMALWTVILFCVGLFASQTDSFQKAIKDWKSGEAQAEMLPYAKKAFDKHLGFWQSMPDALQGGGLLIGSHFDQGPALLLVDGEGNILHRWFVEKRLFNSDILKWWKKPPELKVFAIDDAQMLPGGDVIFTQDLRELDNFRGQRLARMDRDSHVIWQVPGAFHHDFHIVGNQRIYAMTSTLRDQLPVIGPLLPGAHYLEDRIEEYSVDGKKLDSWSIPEAFAGSPFSKLLSSFEIDLPLLQSVKSPDGQGTLYDLLHLNSVQYLDAAKAQAIPCAKDGDLLISLRGINAIAVLRPSARRIVWAKQGPWRHQHYARIEDDGKLYIYDNEGSRVIAAGQDGKPEDELQSRVIRYDAATDDWDEVFASTRIHSFWRGYYYPLPRGYSIISSPEQSRVIVVSPEKKIVWELRGIPDRDREHVPYLKQISTVRYLPPSLLQMFISQRTP